jgi:DNA polymerase-3 subunit gamma/tau
LARAADGSLRDGLSLLDQLIAFGGGRLTDADARAMLGTIDRSRTVQLLDLIAAGDAAGVIREVDALDEHAPDYAAALEELAALIQKVALRQAVPGYSSSESFPEQTLDALAAKVSAEDLQLYYQIALLGRRDLELAPEGRGGFEMVLLRMLAFRPTDSATIRAGSSRIATEKASAAAPGREASPAATSPESWPAIIGALDIQGAARQLANHCSLLGREANRVRLLLDRRGMHYRNPQTEELLVQALRRWWRADVHLEIELAESDADTPARQSARAAEERVESARVELENDATVRALKERFGATLLNDTIKPLS